MKITDSKVTVEVNWAENAHEHLVNAIRKQQYTITAGEVSVPASYVDHVEADGEMSVSISITKEDEEKLMRAIEAMNK